MNGVNRGIFRLLPIFLLLFLGVSSCSQKEERRILFSRPLECAFTPNNQHINI